MIVKEQLKHLFKKGTLDNIHFGISRSRLVEILGNSDWIFYSNEKDNFPSIYKYGRMEFYFMHDDKDEGLSGLVFQPLTRPGSKGNLHLNYYGWNEKLDINKAMDILNKNNIKFQEFPNKRDLDVRVLTTEGNVKIAFDSDDIPGQFYLNKIVKFIDL